MGIKSINPLLKKLAPDAFFTMPLTWLRDKRIAIDASGWMYSNMAIARKKVIRKTDVATVEPDQSEIRKEWILSAINFITGWLANKITPVFVFDGAKTHPEKVATQAKRRVERESHRTKIDELYAQLKGDILKLSTDVLEKLRSELSSYVNISSEDFSIFKSVIQGIGIPCIFAVGDGEQLCSSLCIEGKVAAVFSVDTDNLANGCPLIITGFSNGYSYDEYGNKIGLLDCVRLDKVLAGLNISHDKFVDLCIMCGCDFNSNIPNYGPAKSLKLLRDHGTIDNLPKNFDVTCLNHWRCRDIFSYRTSDEIMAKDDKNDHDSSKPVTSRLNIDKNAIVSAREYTDMAGVSGQLERIIVGYNGMSVTQDGYINQLNLGLAPKYVVPSRTLNLNIVVNNLSLNILPANTSKVTLNVLSS